MNFRRIQHENQFALLSAPLLCVLSSSVLPLPPEFSFPVPFAKLILIVLTWFISL